MFFDEIDSISNIICTKINANFIWFISASFDVEHLGYYRNKVNNDMIDNITCKWAPSYGIANMIEDFIKHYNTYNTLDKFRIIYQKINGFDDLIYKNIMLYLYNAKTNS